METIQTNFPPGAEVQVHQAVKVEVEASRSQRPIPAALEKPIVAEDGTIELNLPSGIYSLAVCIDAARDRWRYVKVNIK